MLTFWIGPLVGGIIGYITNSLAIQMLFRPHRAVYLGKWKLPFTPGLIPKEKGRIAESIGSVVSGELLNNEVFMQTLTSPRILERLDGWFDRLWQRAQNSPKTLRQKLYEVMNADTADGLIRDANEEIARLIGDKLEHFDFGQEIARQGLQSLKEKYTKEFSFKSMLAHILDDNMIESLSESLGTKINEVVSENSQQIVGTFLHVEVDKFLDISIMELAYHLDGRRETIRQTLLDGYVSLIRKDLHRVLRAIDIAGIVRDRIEAYETADLEKLLKTLMRKELRAIVWLGALLGFVMGFVTSFFYG
jgi:uncharacterized membrane protein YheB (UPF0754 family)